MDGWEARPDNWRIALEFPPVFSKEPEMPGRTGALGIALDVYHVWWDPNLEAEIARAGRERLLAFHICDWLVPTTDLLLDRGMMGDGVIDIPRIRGWVQAAGYDGMREVELFSAATWWRKQPEDVVRAGLERNRIHV